MIAKLRAHPSECSVLGLLSVWLIGNVVGLAVYVVKVPKANEGPLVMVSLLFVVA
jgi:hypothetical protein